MKDGAGNLQPQANSGARATDHGGQSLPEAALRFSAARLSGLGAILAAALLVGSAIFLFETSLREFRGSAHWVGHSEEVLTTAAGIQNALFDAWSTTRSYRQHADIQTGAKADVATKSAQELTARLKRLVLEDPDQSRRAALLAGRIAQRLSDLKKLRVLSVPGDETQGVLAFSAGLDDGLSDFRAAEQSLLAQRRRQLQGDFDRLVTLAAVTGFLSLALALAGLWLLQRERARASGRQSQLELQHAQRLALMGEVATKLAHELNQPLAAAGNYVSVIMRLTARSNDRSLADTAERAGRQVQRAGQILHRLRDFIEKRDTVRTLEAPEKVASDTLVLMNSFDTDVQLTTDIAQGLPSVLIDRVQIQQVIVNLLRNAIEAMRHSETREIYLSVRTVPPDQVQFSIADRGPGLAHPIAERLFEPFVSGKAGGMGVGLSICHSIIMDHGGRIWAEPNPQGGTIFHFIVPAVPGSGRSGSKARKSA